MGFAAHGAPHLVELGTEPTTYLERIRTPSLHLHVLGGQVLQHRLIHLVEIRFFFSRVVNLTREQYNGLPFAFLRVQKGT